MLKLHYLRKPYNQPSQMVDTFIQLSLINEEMEVDETR